MADNNNSNNNNRARNKAQIDPTYAHLQPQAVDVERVVLGSLMIDSDAFSMVSEVLKPETFYEPRHQKIYQAIQTMNMEERPVDIMTLTDELNKMGGFGCPCGGSCPHPGPKIHGSSAHPLCWRDRDTGV